MINLKMVTRIVSFLSEPMARLGVSVEHSLLIVCWFTERADTSVPQLVCEGLAGVEWERQARDCYSDW